MNTKINKKKYCEVQKDLKKKHTWKRTLKMHARTSMWNKTCVSALSSAEHIATTDNGQFAKFLRKPANVRLPCQGAWKITVGWEKHEKT